MITPKNYFQEVNKIGIENLSDTFKKSHELVNKVSNNGNDWNMYNTNQTIKKNIDLYFESLSAYQKKDAPMSKKQTTKPKQANESKTTPVETVLIKRYVSFHGKQKTRDQVTNLLKSVQKAILEGMVNKNSQYGKEVMQIQDSLLGALKHDNEIFDIKIEKVQLTHYLNCLDNSPTKVKNGLGVIPEMVAAAISSFVQTHTRRVLTKNKKQDLSGPETEVMTVADVKNANFKEIGFDGDFLKLIGRACAPTSVFIYGNGGSGKSGLSLKLADKLHELNHSVLYVAGEQYGTPAFTELLKKANTTGGDNFKIVKSLSALPIADFDVIVIDSKESLNLKESSKFVALRNAFPDKIWIITSQGTKAGDYKGDGQWLNECEVFIYCENGKATTIGEKNRWAGKAEIKLF